MKRILSILCLPVLVLCACAPTAVVTSAPSLTEVVGQTTTTSSAEPALFKIVKADGRTFDVTLSAVKGLPLAQVAVDGSVEEGPKLIDVLGLAAITDFSEITLTGSSAPVTLTRDQVDDNTILDFTNRGTMKLATTYVPKAQWTKDITEIRVN